jgi:hypothetical protein
MYHHRGEKFPGRFDDLGAERELARCRRAAYERCHRAAAEALQALRGRYHAEEIQAAETSRDGMERRAETGAAVERESPADHGRAEELSSAVSDDHWQGTDVDGTLIDVKGGPLRRYLLCSTGGKLLPYRDAGGFTHVGIIRLIPAA